MPEYFKFRNNWFLNFANTSPTGGHKIYFLSKTPKLRHKKGFSHTKLTYLG